MSIKDFLKDRLLFLICQFVCACILTGFLRVTGYGRDKLLLIQVFWVMALCVWFFVTYWQRSRYFREIERIMDELEERYLLGELLPASFRLEDRLYSRIIKCSNKSVIERIRQIEEEQKDYREYIESWVHEVKAPITGIALLCENGRRDSAGKTAAGEMLRNISAENQRIENYVDMALYFARAEQVYKDYMIRETDLQEVVCEVLERNRLLLIQNNVRAEVECRDRVYTDKKWISFICSQIVLNSVKYCDERAVFSVCTRREENGFLLIMEDNGTGILPEELPRIFEKGFTGSNGRSHERSTGMGLYLCKRLCDKLGIGISASSEYGSGTRIMLEFPVSNYIASPLAAA